MMRVFRQRLRSKELKSTSSETKQLELVMRARSENSQ
jgi:hypothetical protein